MSGTERPLDGADPAAPSLSWARAIEAVPHPVLVLDAADRTVLANHQAEMLFQASQAVLARRPLASFLGPDSVLLSYIARIRDEHASYHASGLRLEGPALEPRQVDLHGAPVGPAGPGMVVLSLRERSVSGRLGQPDQMRSTLRPVSGMAELLAHEIKNPLSGIKGAAQLLDGRVQETDRALTSLLLDEVDRICTLIDRMDLFREAHPGHAVPVNIHEVLDRCQRVAEAGFGRDNRFQTAYDPSLPPVLGERDRLMQVFLNLIKNACEAAGPGGTVTLSTGYRGDLQVKGPGGRAAPHVPLEVVVEDTGPGIPPHIRDTLFEPRVTAKPGGTGLGLALVAKIVADHGGIVDVESGPGRTRFKTRWPVASSATASRPAPGEPPHGR